MKPCRTALPILAITAAGAQPGWCQDVFSESLGLETTYGAIAVAVDPRSPEVLFASSDVDGLFVSRDGGATWQALWSQDGIDHIEIDPGNPDVVYAAGYDIIRSRDGGRTWHVVNDGPGGLRVEFLQVNPHLPGVVYAGQSSGGILRSTDYGETWHRVQESAQVFAMAVDARDSAILYAGGYGLLKSTDGGDSWAPINIPFDKGGLRVSTLAVNPHESGVLTAGVSDISADPDSIAGRIYRSMDEGGSWRMISRVGGWPTGILHDLVHPETLLIGSTGKTSLHGTFLSVDGGFSWQKIHGGGAKQIVASLGEVGTYFAAMRSGVARGVFRISLRDATTIRSAGWGSLKALVAPGSASGQRDPESSR